MSNGFFVGRLCPRFDLPLILDSKPCLNIINNFFNGLLGDGYRLPGLINHGLR